MSTKGKLFIPSRMKTEKEVVCTPLLLKVVVVVVVVVMMMMMMKRDNSLAM